MERRRCRSAILSRRRSKDGWHITMAANRRATITVRSCSSAMRWKRQLKTASYLKFQQFKAIVAEIRAQQFNRVAQESGDFVEFLGLAGLGQAEAAALTPADVNLEAGHIIVCRRKTDAGFAV